jgi:hypothetical protein
MALDTSHRPSTTRAAAGLGLVALAITILVTGCQKDPVAAPEPAQRSAPATPTADQLAIGEPLATYVDPDRLVLYIHGNAKPGTWGGASSVGDLTLAFANDLATVGIFLRGARIGTLRHVVDGVVEASPSGRTLAWVEHTGGAAHLVAAAVTGGRVHELGRLAVDPAVLANDSEGSERVMAVDDEHTVTYGGITSGHTWVPGGDPKDADVSAYLTRATGFPNSVDPPDLNPDGSWGAWPTNSDGRSPVDSEGVWSAVTVQRPRQAATRFTFVMPHADGVQWLYWETGTDLIVSVSGKPPVPGSAVEAEDYVRCNVVDHECEYAPTPGRR